MKIKLGFMACVAGLSLVALLLSMATPIRAAVSAITVTTTTDVIATDGLCSLREAIISANTNTAYGGTCAAGSNFSPDQIVLANGETYVLSSAGSLEDLSGTGDLDITDNTSALDVQLIVAGGGFATIQQTKADRVLDVRVSASVEITGVTFTGGSGVAFGGGVYVDASALLTLSNSEIYGNLATTGGGGLSVTTGKLNLYNTQVYLNSVGLRGGGIYNSSGTVRLLDGSLIRANQTTGSSAYGGGIYQASGSLWIDDSAVNLNYTSGVTLTGGGLFITGTARVTLTNATLESNTTKNGDGGGLYAATGVTVTLIDSNVAGNTADGDGGGVFADGYVESSNTDFSVNHAESAGGGLYNSNPSFIRITGGQFFANTAVHSGGGLKVDRAQLRSVQFISNSAKFGGGVIAHVVWVDDSFFAQNQAGEDGGGLYIVNSFYITTTQFVSNSAKFGGGIIKFFNSGTINNSLFADNQSPNNGSAIFLKASGSLRMIHSTIANSVPSAVSAISITKDTDVVITNTIIANYNKAVIFGSGGIGSVFLSNNVLYNDGAPPYTGPVTLDGLTNLSGDPKFIDAANGNYHIQSNGSAFNTGVASVVKTDFDGQPRLCGKPDIGYDEICYLVRLPIVLKNH